MIDLEKYGFNARYMPENTSMQPSDTLCAARVMAVYKERFAVVCGQGETHARLKSAVYYGGGTEIFPTTGDFVLMEYNPSGDSQIIQTLPRTTCFSRRAPGSRTVEQAVAANFNTVFIMQSLNHDFNAKRLERYLTLAWQSGAVPVVVLTKADLVQDSTPQVYEAQCVAAGVDVCTVSAKTGEGLAALEKYMQPGQTIVFLGSSGVGKSSLVNAVAGQEIMAVSGIREDDSKGRHTTTHRQLVLLQNGVMVIDTPGMREMAMWDVSTGIGEAFAEVEEYFGRCRFSDCTHNNEPGCAVQAAIESGELSEERWASYNKMQQEAKYSMNRSAAMRLKQERNKAIAQKVRQGKQSGKIRY